MEGRRQNNIAMTRTTIQLKKRNINGIPSGMVMANSQHRKSYFHAKNIVRQAIIAMPTNTI